MNHPVSRLFRCWAALAVLLIAVLGTTAAATAAAATDATVISPAAADNPIPAIIGGTDATEDYHVIRLHGPAGWCSGFPTNDHGRTGIITQAHCVTAESSTAPLPAEQFVIQAGSIYADQLTTIVPTRIEVNPDWNWKSSGTLTADAAMIVLPPEVHLPGIALGELAWSSRQVRLAGWGVTSGDATSLPTVLQQIDTRITDPAACATAGITADEICIRQAATGGGACFGDSGSPALGHSVTRRWLALGTASRETSNTCAGATVYSSTRFYAGWYRDAFDRTTAAAPDAGARRRRPAVLRPGVLTPQRLPGARAVPTAPGSPHATQHAHRHPHGQSRPGFQLNGNR